MVWSGVTAGRSAPGWPGGQDAQLELLGLRQWQRLLDGSAQYIATNAYSAQIVNAWLNVPLPDAYFGSYNVTPAIHPSLAHASGQLDAAYLNGYNDLTAPNIGGGSNFGDHVTTVDNQSKGVEIELTTQLLRNWNVTLNYSHVNATHSDIDPAAQAFISKMTGFMNGPGGNIRMWWNGGSSLGSDWNSSIVARSRSS